MILGISKKSVLCITLALISALIINAQENDDREVIIIERTVDEDGNEISKTITRRKGGITDEELNKLQEQSRNPAVPNFDFRNFGDFGQLFGQSSENSKPSLGIMIEFSDGKSLITDVIPGSGADQADIRKGDNLIAIQGETVSSIDDIRNIIQSKGEGERVDVLIFRDGEELNKEVELKRNRSGRTMDFGGDIFDRMLGQDGLFKLDSFFRSFDLDGFNLDGFGEDGDLFFSPEREDEIEEDPRPQLGVFIEDSADGIVVTDVIADSPAEKAGLQKDDVITRLNDDMVTSFSELAMLINQYRKGDKVLLEYVRNGKKSKTEVQL